MSGKNNTSKANKYLYKHTESFIAVRGKNCETKRSD